MLGVQEVPSSNLGSPTKFLKELQARDPPQVAFWSPTGVQNWTPAPSSAGGGFQWLLGCFLSTRNSPELSTPRKTRQTRQFAFNSLITLVKCVSGSPRNPTINPTNCPRKPDKSPARPGCCPVRPRPQEPSRTVSISPVWCRLLGFVPIPTGTVHAKHRSVARVDKNPPFCVQLT